MGNRGRPGTGGRWGEGREWVPESKLEKVYLLRKSLLKTRCTIRKWPNVQIVPAANEILLFSIFPLPHFLIYYKTTQ